MFNYNRKCLHCPQAFSRLIIISVNMIHKQHVSGMKRQSSTVIQMNKEKLLAPKRIFKYFQLLGIHLTINGNEFCWKLFQKLLICGFVLSFVLGFAFRSFFEPFETVSGIVSSIECKLMSKIYSDSLNQFYFIITVTSYTLAALSCVLSSLNNQQKKQKLFKSFSVHDEFMKKNFSATLKYDKINKNLQFKFIFLWLMVITSYIMIIAIMYIDIPLYTIYLVQIEVPNHLIHMQSFQIYIFMRGIERRLHLISMCQFDNIGVDVQICLHQIFTIWKSFYDCMSTTLLMCLLQLYSALLINLYWIGMSDQVSKNNFLGKIY